MISLRMTILPNFLETYKKKLFCIIELVPFKNLLKQCLFTGKRFETTAFFNI